MATLFSSGSTASAAVVLGEGAGMERPAAAGGRATMVFATRQESARGRASIRRGRRITIDSALYVLAMASEAGGTNLNRLARKKFGSYRDAAAVINKLVCCGMISEQISRDHHQIPRVSFAITEKGRAALQVFDGW